MEITDVETTRVAGEMVPEGRDADGTEWLFCIVRIHTDEGVTGIGEAQLPLLERASEMAIHDLGRLLVGQDPRNVEGLWDRLYNAFAWNFGPTTMTALSGIEMALWDLLGKHHGVRVCDLLGGPRTERLPVYGNGVWAGLDAPADYAAAVRDLADRGFDAVKFDPFDAGGRRIWPNETQREAAVERLRAVRDEVGDAVEVGLDSHGVMAPQSAIECAELVEPFDPLFVEEPVPPENHDAMRAIRDRVDVPIATGERLLTTFDYRDFFQHPVAADIVQPDVAHCGGISQLKKIAAMAYNEYVPVAPHNSYGPIATAAAAHAMATTPNFFVLEYFPDTPPWRDEILATPERVAEGRYHLPDGPGLGIELDEAALAALPSERTDDGTPSSYSEGYAGYWDV